MSLWANEKCSAAADACGCPPASRAQIKVPVCVFAFDCLFVDGAPLLRKPLAERRAALAAAMPNLRPGYFAVAHSWELPAPGQPADTAGAVAASGQGSSPQQQQQPQQPQRAAEQAPDLDAEEEPMELDASEDDEVAADVDETPGGPEQQATGGMAEGEEPVVGFSGEPDLAAAEVKAEECEGAAWTDARIEAHIREYLQV
jgi:hypothetical protein